MSDDQETPATRARLLAERLRAEGHDTQADHLEATLAGHPEVTADAEAGHGFLHALRDACQTVLTAIEAIDPSSGTAIEELRLEVDKRLMPHGVPDAEPEEPLPGR
ncbi:MAG: hypothetical protein HIU92_07615 [Proteobacteria bacterium]|nr:hypothetical protein [Pseudomonadota bacterium]